MTKNDFIISNCNGIIVDIGSNNGAVFPERMRENITSVDIDEYDIPNFVRANANSLPFKKNQFDTAVLAEILEHVEDPIKVIKEAIRVSKKLIITVPNEYKWNKDLNPLETMDDKVKRTGKTPEQMAKLSNQSAKDFYTDDNYRHLWHIRFYTKETLEKDIKKSTNKKYKIVDLQENDMFWFGVVL